MVLGRVERGRKREKGGAGGGAGGGKRRTIRKEANVVLLNEGLTDGQGVGGCVAVREYKECLEAMAKE